MPVSGLQGHGLMAPIPEGMCPWYRYKLFATCPWCWSTLCCYLLVLGEDLFVVCCEIFLYDDTNRIYFLNENVDNTINPERYELVCSLEVVSR